LSVERCAAAQEYAFRALNVTVVRNTLFYGDNLEIMREHIADEAGFFEGPSGRKIPKLQIRTIKELLDGKEFDYPRGWSLKSTGKKLVREGEQPELGI